MVHARDTDTELAEAGVAGIGVAVIGHHRQRIGVSGTAGHERGLRQLRRAQGDDGLVRNLGPVHKEMAAVRRAVIEEVGQHVIVDVADAEQAGGRKHLSRACRNVRLRDGHHRCVVRHCALNSPVGLNQAGAGPVVEPNIESGCCRIIHVDRGIHQEGLDGRRRQRRIGLQHESDHGRRRRRRGGGAEEIRKTVAIAVAAAEEAGVAAVRCRDRGPLAHDVDWIARGIEQNPGGTAGGETFHDRRAHPVGRSLAIIGRANRDRARRGSVSVDRAIVGIGGEIIADRAVAVEGDDLEIGGRDRTRHQPDNDIVGLRNSGVVGELNAFDRIVSNVVGDRSAHHEVGR